MDRLPADSELLERILGAESRVVVLRGPAASGKTTAVMAMCRRFLEPDGRSRCLIVVPNAPAARALRLKLLETSPAGVLISPGVVTFTDLAERILRAAGDTGRALPAFRQHLLLRRIVDELSATGELAALGAVADTPGLIVALTAAISELKRAAVEPQTLRSAVGPHDAKGRDLAEIYTRYQRHLHRTHRYDVEGRMWEARDRLAAAFSQQDAPTGLENVEAVAADGFTDFTPTQLDILAAISGRIPRVLITLPHATDERSRLWQWTDRTLNNVRRAFGADVEEIVCRTGASGEAAGGVSPLRAIWDRLFDADAPGAARPEGLRLIGAPGIDAEVTAVARRVKRLLAEGAPPGSIAVLARSMELYRPAIERIFARHDIPVAGAPQALRDAPIVRFVLDAAAVAPQFAFRDVLGVIRNSYFRPQALGAYDRTTVRAAEIVIREGNVLEGRESYADAARRLARRTRAPDDDDEQAIRPGPPAEAVGSAAEMFEKLFDLASAANDAPGIAALIDALDLASAARDHDAPELIGRDLRALELLGETLDSPDEPSVSTAHLRQALGVVRFPPARGEALADVLDVLDARAIRYRHVFVLNVTEGGFPRRFTDSSLLGEQQRRSWRGSGVVLDSRDDLAAREMLLFYLAVSRAAETLTISYQESDASGKAAAPSNFLLSLLEPFGGMDGARSAGALERIAPGEFLAPAGAVSSSRDGLTAAVAGLFDERAGEWRDALSWAVASEPQTIRRAARGLWALHRRWSPGHCDAYDGRIGDPVLLERLVGRYPGGCVFSASQMNKYARCPWWFFAEYVLKLAPLSQPQRRLEPVARGIFCHNVLFGVLNRLRDRCGGPVRLARVEESELVSALDDAVAEASAEVESRRPPYPLLWDLQRTQMHDDLREYLLGRRADDALSVECLHFELGFGMRQGGGPRAADPASRDDPVTIVTPAGDIRLRGKIDRVDRVVFDGDEGLLVIDYKTGRLPGAGDVSEGRDVQLALYAEAVRVIFGSDTFGGAFHRIGGGDAARERFFAAFNKSRGRYKPVEHFDRRRDYVLAKIGELIAGMSGGRFDSLPANKCPSYCPFSRVCGYSPARAEIKRTEPEEASP